MGDFVAWTREIVLAGLVLVFAFLAASSVARNADVWLHLAAGRLLARGEFSSLFGADPFAYTTAGLTWANHAWMYDWILYLLYVRLGGPAVVVVKAALVAGLAAVMLLLRRPGKSGWAPAFCTGLAVLVMSPRLLLQPAIISFVLLGLTNWLLWRPRADTRVERRPRLLGQELDARAVLPLLFALWANLDDWFLLGPVLVGLFWIGDRMRPTPRPTPTWLLPACLLACLCSPYHVYGFTLPADLFPSLSYGGLLQDVRFQRPSLSPWQLSGYLQPSVGLNAAGLSYFLLVALGLLSFVLNRSALRDGRVLVWGFFALLGAWQVRLIPFFAVVAGPITALNLQGVAFDLRPAWAFALRAACLTPLLALVALAPPGWLYGVHQRARPVAWDLEADPSLRRVAETLQGWRERGLLRDGERSFPLHPDVGCYCAWFGSREQSFIDSRFSLFSRAGKEYATVCRELDPDLFRAGGAAGDWKKVLAGRGVAVVILYDSDPKIVLSAVDRLKGDPGEWTLLAVEGQAVIFGWNRGREGDHPFAELRFDAGRAAFGAEEGRAPAAPGRGPGRDPREAGWGPYFGRPPAISPDSAAANIYLRLYEDADGARKREAVDQYYVLAATGFAGLAGLPAVPAGPPECVSPVLFRLGALDEALMQITDRPPELPLLAVRAARRAVAANPDDANAYLRLAQAYLALRNDTLERSRGGALTPLGMLRHVQIVTALRQALLLNSNIEAAHHHLADLLTERRLYDAALDHRRDELDLSRRAPRPGESSDAFQRRLAQMDKQVQELENFVQPAQDQFAIRSQPLSDDPLARAEMAVDLGLGRQALEDILLQSRVELFGSGGARLQLKLLLLLGRADEARALLNDEEMKANKYKLTMLAVPFADQPEGGSGYLLPAYEWLAACAAAALGDYDPADAALEEIGEGFNSGDQAYRAEYHRSLAVVLTSEIGVLSQPRLITLPLLLSESRELEAHLLFLRVERADVLALRGLLALERGEPAEAEHDLEQSLAVSLAAKDSGADCPSRPLARAYLLRLRAAHD